MWYARSCSGITVMSGGQQIGARRHLDHVMGLEATARSPA